MSLKATQRTGGDEFGGRNTGVDDLEATEPAGSVLRGPREALKHEEMGALTVGYNNGHRQHVLLRSELLRPMVVASPPVITFGRVHVDDTRSAPLHVSNPTIVPAAWRLEHVPWPPPRERVTVDVHSLGLEDMGQEDAWEALRDLSPGATHVDGHAIVDDPSVFDFSARGGVLQGPTAAPESGPVSGLRTNAVAKPMQLDCTFDPHSAGLYRCRFRVTVDGGEGFEFVAVGRCTLSEADASRAIRHGE